MNPMRSTLVCALGISLLTTAAQAVVITSNSGARFGSGNVTKGEDSVSGVSLPLNGSTGPQVAANTHLAAATEGVSNLDHNAIASGSHWIGASNINPDLSSGTIWWLGGSAFVRYDDNITVESSTLAPGTDVQIQFSIHTAWNNTLTHDKPSGGQLDAWTYADLEAHAIITNRFTTNYHIQPGDNQLIRSYYQPGTNVTTGIFASPTHHIDFIFDAQIGDTIRFITEIETRTSGELRPWIPAPGQGYNTSGACSIAAALVFGATPLYPAASSGSAAALDITLNSEILQAPFPDAAGANQANALAAIPDNPIPEPATVTLLIAFALGQRRRYRN